MQENWIGKSTGAYVRFKLVGRREDRLTIFTTRPDTLFGASFMAVSPDHPLAEAGGEADPKAAAFIAECKAARHIRSRDRGAGEEGLSTRGSKREHPFITGKTLPVYIANFVLMEYGTGAIFGCPAHDQRDLDCCCWPHATLVPTTEDPTTCADAARPGRRCMIGIDLDTAGSTRRRTAPAELSRRWVSQRRFHLFTASPVMAVPAGLNC